jgi:hypothetical protein
MGLLSSNAGSSVGECLATFNHVLRGAPTATMAITVGGYEVSDVALSVTVPFLVYWLTALYYESVACLKASWLDKYRIHDRTAEKHVNLVCKLLVCVCPLLHKCMVKRPAGTC